MKKLPIRITAARALVIGTLLTTGFMYQPALAEEKEAAVVIPETSVKIWQSIDAESDTISKMIQSGNLKELHHHAFGIRDLVAALPDHSTTLRADKLAKVKSDGKFVTTIADRLDAAGDSNDKAAAQTNFDKLKNILTLLRANYSVAKSEAK